MREVRHCLMLQLSALLLLCCIHKFNCSLHRSIESPSLLGLFHDTSLSSVISASIDPQPLVPLVAPSPLMPVTIDVVPKLSGPCRLDFLAHESLLNTTATDCWGPFAPYVANAICCPQLKATLTILIGNSSNHSGELALNSTLAKHCLSDVDQILQSKGALGNLHKMCSIRPFNLTQGSCPVINVKQIDQIVDYSQLVAKCGKFDVVSECCTQACQQEISEAALKIALKGYDKYNKSSAGTLFKSKLSVATKDCESVILRWLTTKLDLVSVNGMIRGISSCDINKVCPLVLPNTTDVAKNCGITASNQTACCNAMGHYMSLLQEQTLITNLQAMNCAELLGITLQKANITWNVFDLCQIKLKDFTLQATGASVSSQGSGCLLPSLPSDIAYDNTYGISFVCDLGDNVAATWPSSSFSYASSCNNSTMLPALPKATSAATGVDDVRTMFVVRTMFPMATLILLLFV